MTDGKIRCYTELSQIRDFNGRYRYLRLSGPVGIETFGSKRYLNQRFYRSFEWRHIRNRVIARDGGRDLGIEGHEIYEETVHIHHMNPVTERQIVHRDATLLDPEFLITVTLATHNAIHYGDESRLVRLPVIRKPGDTTLW
jgi:hypothetical protein